MEGGSRVLNGTLLMELRTVKLVGLQGLLMDEPSKGRLVSKHSIIPTIVDVLISVPIKS
jgi:hypothetical protein